MGQGDLQAPMVLEKELRVVDLDVQAKGNNCNSGCSWSIGDLKPCPYTEWHFSSQKASSTPTRPYLITMPHSASDLCLYLLNIIKTSCRQMQYKAHAQFKPRFYELYQFLHFFVDTINVAGLGKLFVVSHFP